MASRVSQVVVAYTYLPHIAASQTAQTGQVHFRSGRKRSLSVTAAKITLHTLQRACRTGFRESQLVDLAQ